MTKPLVILQPFGIGDQIFCSNIAHKLMEDGWDVIWPTKKEWVNGLRKAYPEINWVAEHFMTNCDFNNRKMFEVINGIAHFPMRFAEWILGRPYPLHMVSKYDLIGMDWREWKKHAYPARDILKERELFFRLNPDHEKYNFIVQDFGSAGNYSVPIEVNNSLKNITLSVVDGYSLFDWCTIIECADNIHAVSSSTLYLFELLELNATEINLYVRKPVEQNFNYVEFLFTKNYIQHL